MRSLAAERGVGGWGGGGCLPAVLIPIAAGGSGSSSAVSSSLSCLLFSSALSLLPPSSAKSFFWSVSSRTPSSSGPLSSLLLLLLMPMLLLPPSSPPLALLWLLDLSPPVPGIIDLVFLKTSPKRAFSMTKYERFGLVFTKTRVYKFRHRSSLPASPWLQTRPGLPRQSCQPCPADGECSSSCPAHT